MTGRFVDSLFYRNTKPSAPLAGGFFFLTTDCGTLRVFEAGDRQNPTLINVPDGPNVIEHQMGLIEALSKHYHVICFEYPGLGLSYPSPAYDYSFDAGSRLLIQVMNILNVEQTSLLFSCSNSFYALNATRMDPDRFSHVFISQTPSVSAMATWTRKSIPDILKIPVVGQLANIALEKKLAHLWFQYALPKESTHRRPFREKAKDVLSHGGCFCLSSLVQNLQKETGEDLLVERVPVTLVWGAKDFTHRKTKMESIRTHVPYCEIIAFEECGHFPELEDTGRYVSLVKERI